MNRGKLVIIGIFSLAAVMGLFGLWFNYRQGFQATQLWGSQEGLLIRYAPRVDLLSLEPVDEPATGGQIKIGPNRFSVAASKEISQVRGLIHARHALIEDASFDWAGPQPDCSHEWTFGLRFTREDHHATLVFDQACGAVRLLENRQTGRLREEIMQAFVDKEKVWKAN